MTRLIALALAISLTAGCGSDSSKTDAPPKTDAPKFIQPPLDPKAAKNTAG